VKKLTLSLLSALAVLSAPAAHAFDGALLARDIALASAKVSGDRSVNNLINWKVGEFQNSKVEAMGMALGDMKKIVASEEGNNIWLVQEMTGMMGNQKVEVLMDRATGQVIEMRQNGKKVDVPNDPLEVIDQESTTVTVPAGTFDCIKITAKSAQVKKLEMWANPRDITLDGAAQVVMESNQLPVPITMKLVEMGGR
jgi:hypothetical protein